MNILCLLLLCSTLSLRFHSPCRIPTYSTVEWKMSRSRSIHRCSKLELGDNQKLKNVLSNISASLDNSLELAISAVSQEIGWLLSHNITGLMEETILSDNDIDMKRAYYFMVDFLEAIVVEMESMLQRRRETLRIILEAAKLGEDALNNVISLNYHDISDPEFLVFLDSEIDCQSINSSPEALLVTIKLRVLDEIGFRKGVDITMIPKLAAESNDDIMRINTLKYLKNFDLEGQELFLVSLKTVVREIETRYIQMDGDLLVNLKKIEDTTKESIQMYKN